ncbi:uncharacterized membrane protein (DUF485 family) [Myroides gitamensis]|nr:uncharacterized membrane protein (DUF485 family) [Myroides gitamensis]
MLKILKYSCYDLMRSRWSYFYLGFYLLLGFVLLFLNHDIGKAIITLMNIIIVLVPLISTIFGIMYYYDSKEFTELLLALPIKRSSIFIGTIPRCCAIIIDEFINRIGYSFYLLWSL